MQIALPCPLKKLSAFCILFLAVNWRGCFKQTFRAFEKLRQKIAKRFSLIAQSIRKQMTEQDFLNISVCALKHPPQLDFSNIAFHSEASIFHYYLLLIPGRNKNVFTMQKCNCSIYLPLHRTENVMHFDCFSLISGWEIFIQRISPLPLSPTFQFISLMNYFNLLIDRLVDSTRNIVWVLISKKTLPACERACWIKKYCTDEKQIFHGFVKGFLDFSTWQARDVGEVYLMWVRNETSHSCYLWRGSRYSRAYGETFSYPVYRWLHQ